MRILYFFSFLTLRIYDSLKNITALNSEAFFGTPCTDAARGKQSCDES